MIIEPIFSSNPVTAFITSSEYFRVDSEALSIGSVKNTVSFGAIGDRHQPQDVHSVVALCYSNQPEYV